MGGITPTLALLRCYERLDMPGCGGVDIADLRRTVKRRRKITRIGACNVWEWSDTLERHMAKDFARGQFAYSDLKALEDVGLLRWVRHLRDGGEDGGNLSPYDKSDVADPLERELADKIDELTDRLCSFADSLSEAIAVPAHVADPQLVLVARPTYLPRTKPVKAWRGELDALQAFPHPFCGASAILAAAAA
jgi:hypothetical protein